MVVSICLFIWNVFLWLYLGNGEAFCFTCEYMFIPNQRHGASVWGAFSNGWCYHAASIEVRLVHIVIFLCWFSYEILLIFSYEMWLIELLRVTTSKCLRILSPSQCNIMVQGFIWNLTKFFIWNVIVLST